jgi:hypothetical protein
MSIRSSRTQVTFRAPFSLPELDGLQPAGTYDVDTDEECIEGNEHTVYIRLATVLHVHSPGSTRFVTIDPAGLGAALERDAATRLP